MRRPPPPLLALGGGLCLAAATPPWGFWIFAFAGIVLLDQALDGPTAPANDGPVQRPIQRPIQRLGLAWIVWAALLFPSLFWMRALTLPGYLIASFCYAGFLAVGTLAAPRGPGRHVALAGGVILAEWVRWQWPFGGVPLSNLAMGQVEGVLAPMFRVGGALFVVGMTVTAGSALAAAVKGRYSLAAGMAAFTVAVLLVGVVAPDGAGTGEFLDVALVQGGGPQGTRADETEPGIVIERHLAASADLDPDRPVDLLLWPEDVVDVVQLSGSDEERDLQDLARRTDAVFVAGIVEDAGTDGFHNWAVAYGRDGEEVDRYEKVERVPFGEWVPFRGLLESVAGDALPARDALIGTTPAVLHTSAGTLGVSISWEIFFGERAREAVNHGARILLNPTNGASFDGTQVQTQQVASSRMRALEHGRWVLQIAPTGFSAVVDPDGAVRQRTAVSERRILYDRVELRTGRTWYARTGDAVALVYAFGCLAAGWALERVRPRRSRSPARR